MTLKVLICGATGFIGRNLVERFASDPRYSVMAVWNRVPAWDCLGVRWEKADLLRTEDVGRVVAGQDVVIQAAATTSGARDIVERPYIHICDNAVMNSLLLRAAYEASVGYFVFFSRPVMYPSGGNPLKESDMDGSAGIRDEYFGAGWTKAYIEKMCRFYSRLGPATQSSATRTSTGLTTSSIWNDRTFSERP